MAALFSLSYLLVLLELVACSHFRGGVVQWRPLNNDPMSFNGQVSVLSNVHSIIKSLWTPRRRENITAVYPFTPSKLQMRLSLLLVTLSSVAPMFTVETDTM